MCRLAASVILDITYGYQVNEDEDAIVNFVKHTMDEFSEAAVPGAQLVDTFPWCTFQSHMYAHEIINEISGLFAILVPRYGIQR
jgi:hypothetical protein